MRSNVLYNTGIVIAFLCVATGSGCAHRVSLKSLSRDYSSIESRYRARISRDPHDTAAKLALAEFYYRFNDYEKIPVLLEGLAPVRAQALLAKSYAHLKEWNHALDAYERAQKIPRQGSEPQDDEFWYLYGTVLEKKNLYSRAIEIYGKVKNERSDAARERIDRIKTKAEGVFPVFVGELSKKASSFLSRMEDEAAATLFVDEAVTITPENTRVTTVHAVEKILQERGKELAEVEFGYDSTYERVELEFARTISKDGKVIYAGEENIRDVSRYLNFPLYSNARVFLVSMPLVEVGSFIEYKIKVYSSKLINTKDFNFLYRLREKYPVFKARFSVSVPSFRQVRFKFFNQERAGNHTLSPRVSTQGTRTVYEWELKEIEPLIPEYTMPPVPRVNPAVLISSFSSWDEIYVWWKDLYKDALTLDDDTVAFVKNLTKDAESTFDKVKAVYEFCARDIRYVAVEYGQSGYKPHNAQEVFMNRYGDCKDQAVLLIAMLRSIGIEGYPVLIPTRSVYGIEADFPSLNFNHAIAAIKKEGSYIFMDATAETTSFGDIPLADQDRNVLVFTDDGPDVVRTPQLHDNGVLYSMRIQLDDEENALITREVTTEGFYTARHRAYLKYTHPSHIKDDILQKMIEISAFSELKEFTIQHADSFDKAPLLMYTFRAEKFLNPAGALRVVPPIDEMQLDPSMVSKAKRTFPIDLSGIFKKQARIAILLPPSLKVQYVPENTIITTPWFDFESSYSTKEDSVECAQQFSVKKRFVSPDEYLDFKTALQEVFYVVRGEVILKSSAAETTSSPHARGDVSISPHN